MNEFRTAAGALTGQSLSIDEHLLKGIFVRLWNLGASVLALFVVACGGEIVTEEQQTAGTLQLPLVSQAPNGKVYRVAGATFNIVGPQTVTLTDTSADTVQTTLEAGAYTVEIAGAWTLERVDAPGVFVPVTSQLLSPNPLPFFVTKGATSQVRFQFKLPGDGSADVGIKVDSGGWLAGTIQFTELEYPGSGPSAFDELVGKSVPFLLSYDTATITKEGPATLRVLSSAPITVQFGGPPSSLLQRAAAAMSASAIEFQLMAYSDGRIDFMGPMYMGDTGGFRLDLFPNGPAQGEVDSQGYPSQRPFQFNATAVLRDYNNGVRGTVTVNGAP